MKNKFLNRIKYINSRGDIMKKLILIPSLLVLLSSVVLADSDMMGDFGMMGTGGWMMGGLYGLVYFVIASFIFSITFWLTYKWLIKDKKR